MIEKKATANKGPLPLSVIFGKGKCPDLAVLLENHRKINPNGEKAPERRGPEKVPEPKAAEPKASSRKRKRPEPRKESPLVQTEDD